MLEIATAGLTALFMVALSPPAGAQLLSKDGSDRLSAADWDALTDLRIDVVKGALQLRPDQTQYWSAVEDAIRARAKNRQARMAKVVETVGSKSNETAVELLLNRDPVSFLNRRAETLSQRAADLKKLASAWQPLYQTLSPDQKRRMAAVGMFVLREMSDAVEQRRADSQDDD